VLMLVLRLIHNTPSVPKQSALTRFQEVLEEPFMKTGPLVVSPIQTKLVD